MKMRNFVIAMQCVVGALGATAATAAPTDEGRLVQRVKDRASGLEVRVYVGGAADVSIEVGDRTVLIQKQLVHGVAVTSLSTPSERLQLAVDARGLTVDGTLGRVEASATRPGSFDAARGLLSRSVAVDRAIKLLGRLDLGPRSPVGHTLFVTRAMLQSETGDARGAVELARWAQGAKQALAVTPVAWQTGPGDCWTEYTKEAIAAYDELEDCLRDIKWYDLTGELSCGTIYDLRAIGAFSWWLHCVALNG